MFTNNVRSTSKSTLKNELKVANMNDADQHKEQSNVGYVVSYVIANMNDADVCLIFDRYEDYSIK